MIQAGSRLAHYEITDELGKGGMGEVYRARDTKLGREVAIKVLPSEFASDAERLARLEREARMLAALNHPNIAAIHGLEESDDTRFLVLELVEGDTLADRLGRGAMAPEESLKLALQIAEAVEAAHEKGVIHRDLKPANIKITPEGRVKVLDFGLAKAFVGDQPDVNLSNSPTLSMQATRQGVILGTAAYMSPEQARGETADKRTDVWAFGCVLFEMLSGRGTFDGKTVSDVLAGVLRAEPEWSTLPANLHPRIRLLLERCLEKDPADRYHDIAEARVDIQRVLADGSGVLVQPVVASGVAPVPASKLPWIAGVVLAVLTGLAVWWLAGGQSEEPRQLARFTIDMPADAEIIPTTGWRVLTLSPDGSTIAYAGLALEAPAGRTIYIRRLDELEAVPLRGSEGGTAPFFSPDGQTVGFVGEVGGNVLKRVSVQGGPETTIATFNSTPYGMHWGHDDHILFSVDGQLGLFRVPAVGGDVEEIATPDVEAGELVYSQGFLLPDGDTVLFTVQYMGAEPGLARLSLATREVTPLGIRGSHVKYIPTGHLVYAVSDGTIRSVPFDLDRLEVTDTNPTPLVEGLHTGTVANYVTGNFQVAANGTIVYMTGVARAIAGRDRRAGLVWVDRDGEEEGIGLQPDDYTLARVSPDGTMVVLVLGDGTPGSTSPPPDLWVLDLVTGIPRQLTFDPGSDDAPVWTTDSSRILFRSNRSGSYGVYAIPAEGGEAELVFSSPDAPFIYPWSLSPDGETLAAINALSLEDTDVATVTLGEAQLTNLLTDEVIAESEPVIAPNGAWIVFQEGETPEIAQQQITFRPFPGFARARFPAVPGMHPVFSGDGSELFYFDGEGIAALPLEYEPSIRWQPPRQLFDETYWWGAGGPDGSFGRAWDYDPVSDRFLMITMPEQSSDTPEEEDASEIIVVLNWTDELREMVPVP